MADVVNEQVKSKRDSMVERLKGRYPDKTFEDDEQIYGQISDDYDGYDKDIADYQAREKAISDLYNRDPRSAAFVDNWRNGADPVVELVRQFGTDIKDAIDDPERLDAIASANKEFVDRVAKAKELDAQYQANVAESIKTIEQLQKEKGYSDEQIDAAMAFLVGIYTDGVLGKYSAESIEMAMKALNHDADVATANQEGLVQGKNTKVEEKLRKPKGGDGLANLDGANTQPKTQQPKKRYSIFDTAREAE